MKHCKQKYLLQPKRQVLRIVYSSPLSVSLDANGSFGAVDGKVDLANKDLRIDFVEVGDIGMIQSHLTKDEKGWFYEKSF